MLEWNQIIEFYVMITLNKCYSFFSQNHNSIWMASDSDGIQRSNKLFSGNLEQMLTIGLIFYSLHSIPNPLCEQNICDINNTVFKFVISIRSAD